MIEFCIGFFIGTVYTFICILVGSLVNKEDDYEEKKSVKGEKYSKDKR